MRSLIIITILPLLWWAFDVRAQEPQEFSSMPEQWQLSLDVIKSKAQYLVTKNNGLQVEYQRLTGQTQELEQSIEEQQDKNDQGERFLKERHGRTDQQLRIDELTQVIRSKDQKTGILDEQLRNLENKQSNLEGEIRSFQKTIQSPEDDQLPRWRRQLEDETRQEVFLENELQGLKVGHQIAGPVQQPPQGSVPSYEQLKNRRDQLEDDINTYESRLEELRASSIVAFSWTLKRKKLVHEMVLTDAGNNKMRETIKALREDIDVLKDRIAKLERRMDLRGQGAKQ